MVDLNEIIREMMLLLHSKKTNVAVQVTSRVSNDGCFFGPSFVLYAMPGVHRDSAEAEVGNGKKGSGVAAGGAAFVGQCFEDFFAG